TYLTKYSRFLGALSLNNVHCLGPSFIYLDPKGASDFQKIEAFQNWKDICKSRADLSGEWFLEEIKHPIQTYNSNCGILVCLFLSQLLDSNKSIQVLIQTVYIIKELNVNNSVNE
ncbi:unnamed protein product, partial [Brachionus calyciflorus]